MNSVPDPQKDRQTFIRIPTSYNRHLHSWNPHSSVVGDLECRGEAAVELGSSALANLRTHLRESSASEGEGFTRMRRFLKIIGALILLIVALPWILFLASFIDTVPEQDRCDFGSVTNVEYRELLARAKIQDWTVWPGLSSGLFFASNRAVGLPVGDHRRQMTDGLAASIRTSISSKRSPDELFAAAHAVMRSFGAQYNRTVLLPRNLSTERPRREYIYLEYLLPQRRFAPMCLHCFLWDLTAIAVDFERDLSGEIELNNVHMFHGNIKNSPQRLRESSCPSTKIGKLS